MFSVHAIRDRLGNAAHDCEVSATVRGPLQGTMVFCGFGTQGSVAARVRLLALGFVRAAAFGASLRLPGAVIGLAPWGSRSPHSLILQQLPDKLT